MTFTKLRGVTPDRLDEVTASFDAADWDDLYNCHLAGLALDSIDVADGLGIPEHVDSMTVISRLYLAYVATLPEGQP